MVISPMSPTTGRRTTCSCRAAPSSTATCRSPEQVQEFVAHSWYEYPDESKGLHPWDGITEPHFELGPDAKGTKTNIKQLDENAKYSFVKAPRWRGNAMEVGPLARYVVAYPGRRPAA